MSTDLSRRGLLRGMLAFAGAALAGPLIHVPERRIFPAAFWPGSGPKVVTVASLNDLLLRIYPRVMLDRPDRRVFTNLCAPPGSPLVSFDDFPIWLGEADLSPRAGFGYGEPE